MINVIPNIPAVGDQESQANRMYNKIYILLDDHVDYSKLPEIDTQARTCAAFTLKEGGTWAELCAVKNTAGRTTEGSQGDITTAVQNGVTLTVGGSRPEIENLLENFVGRNVHVTRRRQRTSLYSQHSRLPASRSFWQCTLKTS